MANRRHFLLSATSMGIASLTGIGARPVNAQAVDDDGTVPGLPTSSSLVGQDNGKINIKPYLEIGDFAEDRNRVFLFFLYTCPFCAQYAESFEAWGRTIPKPVLFVPVPLMIDDPTDLSAAAAYYVARSLIPDRMAEFEARAYDLGQRRDPMPTAKDFPQILYGMGLRRDVVLSALHSPETRDRLLRAAALARRYRVSATPDFGVGGRYTTNANYTGGKYGTLVQLLNGLISRAMNS